MFVTFTLFLIASIVPRQIFSLFPLPSLLRFSCFFPAYHRAHITVPQQVGGCCECSSSIPASSFLWKVTRKAVHSSQTNFPTTKPFCSFAVCSVRGFTWQLLQTERNTMMPIMMPFNSLLLFFFLLVTVIADSDRCYSPIGDSVDSVSSCWQTGLCCREGDLCLNSTLCVTHLLTDTPSYYRGSCLDRTWEDPTCPNFCLAAGPKEGTVAVYPCADKDTNTRWYCDGDGPPHATCDSVDGYFDLSGMWSSSLSRLGGIANI